METYIKVILIGAGATAFIDAWALLRRRLFGTRLPDYSMVGRWIALMFSGRFVHDSIARAPAVPGEHLIGWTAHYATGTAFAALMPLCFGRAWIDAPTFLPAFLVGVITVAAPFLLMQPAMGAGIAASRTPAPRTARLQSVINHTLFGVGLYLSALLIAT